MATGDQNDMQARLTALLPSGWFPDTAQVMPAVLAGLASMWSWGYAQVAYAKLQTRVGTATDQFLDIAANDFFGSSLRRRTGEIDANYRRRILAELLAPKNTRAAVIAALVRLTGFTPKIFEPALTTDTGGWTVGGWGFDAGGGWGSLQLPYQFFMTAYRPTGGGIAKSDGFNGSLGGYGVGALQWANVSMIAGTVTDGDIYEAVDDTIPAGTIGWVQITNAPAVPAGVSITISSSGSTTTVGTTTSSGAGSGQNELDVNFILDQSILG